MGIRIPTVLAAILILVPVATMSGCAGPANTIPRTVVPAPAFDDFTLAADIDPARRAYLGITTPGPFPITRIRARLLLIEVFSIYCPHCQREAPQVNELYRRIEKEGLSGKIKVIGIGAGNSDFEVNLFREKYRVPFPLFADSDLSLARGMGVRRTPTFLAVRLAADGAHRRVLFHAGQLGTPENFLEKLKALTDP